MDIKITVIDRTGESHQLQAPTDIAMNLMEVCKAYELPVEGPAVEWPCVLPASVIY